MIHSLVTKHKCIYYEVGMGNDNTADDQELAKALAGINSEVNEKANEASTDLSFEETPSGGAVEHPNFGAPAPVAAPAELPAAPALPSVEPVVVPTPAPEPVMAPAAPSMPIPSDNGDLDTIKKDALNELRPLVDKLTVPPEEKFDTYLLLLRSTDDESLIAPAHAAAKDIPDEARRAQALLDVIKEIDYLASHGKKL